MPPHGRYPVNVRWRPTGFEMRCEDCKAKGYHPYWWPLTEEFWNVRRGLTRCRVCWLAYKSNQQRAAYAANPEPKRAADRVYHAANRDLLNWKRSERKKRAREAAA